MRKPQKPQERTAITRDLLLGAAEQVFAQRGYEKAQLEEIAQASGFSKGALYAHFKSKEELFLALAKTKAASYQTKLRLTLSGAPTREAKIAAFRSFYVNLSKEKRWALLILEAKLFVTRYPGGFVGLRKRWKTALRKHSLNSSAPPREQSEKPSEESSLRSCLKLI